MEDKMKYDRIINAVQTAFILTVDGIVLEANEYSQKHIGIKIGDDIRRHYYDSLQYDTIHKMTEKVGATLNIIVQYHVKDAGIHHFLANYTVVDYDGKKAYIQWAIDIENIEKDEMESRKIRIMQQSMQTVLDSLPIPIRIVDLESTRISYVNDSLLELLKYDSADELCGLSISDILPDFTSDGTDTSEIVDMLMKAANPVSFGTEYLTKTGGLVEAMETTRLIDYKGRRSSIGIIKDLTSEKERSQVLLRAMEREKIANQAKSQFLANMSHEIRTPMNGVIGMTDLLLEEKLSESQLQYVKDIKMSADSLLNIINDILDLSKISGGKLQIIPADIEIGAMLQNVVSMMSFSAHAKGLEFIDDIRIRFPAYVRVDDVRLKQVIVNLLSNAIKFTKSGSVRLTAVIEDGNIKFEVSDTGIGIKKENLSLIFTAFEQADKQKNRAIKGTGLGLSISKSLIELMDGRIWVESVYGAGSTFFVSIPYIHGNESAVETTESAFAYICAPTAKVLLVDDIQINLTVGAGLLRMCGITADVALSGYEAIDLVKARDYDIIFMDHMMPELDGIETMKIIRNIGEKYRKLPIIALTANAVNESKAMMLDSGMNDFLAKPMDKAALMAILKKWLPPNIIQHGVKSDTAGKSEGYSEVFTALTKIDGLDTALALKRMGGRQDVLEKSIKQVANLLDGHLKKMDIFLSNEDLHGFAIEAHGLKGALANIGATLLSELAAELEIAAKAENTPLCMNKFPVFNDKMEAFAASVKSALSQTAAQGKPSGTKEFFIQKLCEVIDCLDAFEAGAALELLQELEKYTFGQDLDAMLGELASLIGMYHYEKATRDIKNIINTAAAKSW